MEKKKQIQFLDVNFRKKDSLILNSWRRIEWMFVNFNINDVNFGLKNNKIGLFVHIT